MDLLLLSFKTRAVVHLWYTFSGTGRALVVAGISSAFSASLYCLHMPGNTYQQKRYTLIWSASKRLDTARVVWRSDNVINISCGNCLGSLSKSTWKGALTPWMPVTSNICVHENCSAKGAPFSHILYLKSACELLRLSRSRVAFYVLFLVGMAMIKNRVVKCSCSRSVCVRVLIVIRVQQYLK